MRCACVDIGSNTTALLVADVKQGELRTVAARKAFTLLGAAAEEGAIPPAKIEEVCDAVREFLDYAIRLGAKRRSVVATHVVREANNAELVAAMIEQHCGTKVRVLTADQEARYSFAGAIGGKPVPTRPTIVVDAGGGSTEFTWCAGAPDSGRLHGKSFPIGSSSLRSAHLISDPPTDAELRAARQLADELFAALPAPSNLETALAVGGGATTAREIVGGLIDEQSVARALKFVTGLDSGRLAERLAIERQRARLLPAGLILLAAASARIGVSLEVGLGGLREGVIYELAA